MVVLGNFLLRVIASKTSFVLNRTRMITSGRDTLTSLVITIACNALATTLLSAFCLAVLVPLWMLDFRRHGQVYPSFGPTNNLHYTYADAFLMIANVGLAFGSAIEHFTRYEVLSEAVLMEAGVGKPVLRAWQWKRRVSAASVVACAVLFYLDKTAAYFLPLFRAMSSMCVLALLLALANCNVNAWRYLWDIVHSNGKDLIVDMKRRGFLAPATWELRWEARAEHGPRSVRSFIKQILALVLWHVGSRSNVANLTFGLYIANLLPLIPAVQYEFFAAAALFSATHFVARRQFDQNHPTCVNTSGADIPPVHVGFGMLVEKGQLLRSDSAAPCVYLKMVPATIERLAEAVTVSYRWDDDLAFPLRVWSRDEPESVHASHAGLSHAFALMAAHGVAVDDRSLIWLDKASIDQQSDSFMKMLVPKMAACYALSECTLGLDNTHKFAAGTPNNYFSRTWTFQEYCLPPTLAMVQAAGSTCRPDADLRADVQTRFWRAPTLSPTFQPFTLIWLDAGSAIKDFLIRRPEVVKEYLHAAETRMGYYSSDRFAAIMQTVSGVMCFTPEGINKLKRIVLEAIAEHPSLFEGCAVLDNTGWGTQLSGCTTWERVLAGRPCPGDHGPCSSLTLTDVTSCGFKPKQEAFDYKAPASTTDQSSPRHMLQLHGKYVPPPPAQADDDAGMQPAAIPIPVTAVLDQDARVVLRLSVAPAAGVAQPERLSVGEAAVPAALEPAGSMQQPWIQVAGSKCTIHAA